MAGLSAYGGIPGPVVADEEAAAVGPLRILPGGRGRRSAGVDLVHNRDRDQSDVVARKLHELLELLLGLGERGVQLGRELVATAGVGMRVLDQRAVSDLG